jgi:hypothetical protein
VCTNDDPAAIRKGWEQLELIVPLRGRKFFGAFDPATKEYRACVRQDPGDDAAALGLESGTLPGGRFLRARLEGEPPAIYERIGPTFDSMASAAAEDLTRPSIEFYRRRDKIELYLPILPEG